MKWWEPISTLEKLTVRWTWKKKGDDRQNMQFARNFGRPCKETLHWSSLNQSWWTIRSFLFQFLSLKFWGECKKRTLHLYPLELYYLFFGLKESDLINLLALIEKELRHSQWLQTINLKNLKIWIWKFLYSAKLFSILNSQKWRETNAAPMVSAHP